MRGDTQILLPRRCTLDGFAAVATAADGVRVLDLPSLSSVLVRTENTLYRIIIIEPLEATILIQGGAFFAESTRGRLNGSSDGGSFLKLGWIGRGFRMEIAHDGRRIVTSRVRSIDVGSSADAPGPF